MEVVVGGLNQRIQGSRRDICTDPKAASTARGLLSME